MGNKSHFVMNGMMIVSQGIIVINGIHINGDHIFFRWDYLMVSNGTICEYWDTG